MDTFRDSLTNHGVDEHLEDLMMTLASQSSYWSACKKFYDERYTQDLDLMSPKQKAWALKICLDLYEHYESSITADFR